MLAVLVLVAALVSGCACSPTCLNRLELKPTDSAGKKCAKVGARILLAPLTFGGSELQIAMGEERAREVAPALGQALLQAGQNQHPYRPDVTCNVIGNMLFCSDGTSCQRIGNSIYCR